MSHKHLHLLRSLFNLFRGLSNRCVDVFIQTSTAAAQVTRVASLNANQSQTWPSCSERVCLRMRLVWTRGCAEKPL